MFRTNSCCNNIRTILHYRRSIDCHLVSIFGYPRYCAVNLGDARQKSTYPRPRSLGTPTRDPCPPKPPPPPKPPKNDAWLWGTLAVILVASVGIVTAKGSPEIRDWLTMYAPYIDELIAFLYEENQSHSDFLYERLEDFKKYMAKLNDKPICDPNKDDYTYCECKHDEDSGQKKPIAKVEEIKEDVSQTAEKPMISLKTRDICEIGECIKQVGEDIEKSYVCAKNASTHYNGLIDQIMETNFSLKGFEKLAEAKEMRDKNVKLYLNDAREGIIKLDEMNVYLDRGVTAPRTEIEKMKKEIRNIRLQYKISFMEFQFENDYSNAKEKQWQMVQKELNKYINEMETSYPKLKYTDNQAVFTGDPDILLYNTYSKILRLRNDIDSMNGSYSDRVDRAYKSLDSNPEKSKARDAGLKLTVEQKRVAYAKALKERYDQQKKANDQRLQELSKEQKDKFAITMDEKLKEKEKEIYKKFDKIVDEQVSKERQMLDAQLEDMSGRLRIVEEKFNARLKAERETRRSQELWAAGASLLNATKKAGVNINVCKELKAIEKASGDDQLVKTVLKSIPKNVYEKGLQPEHTLKESYKIMEDTALKVALVEETGAYMPVYILSWMQAILLFMKIPGIPQKEYEHPAKKPCPDLDTFDLLQRARFWMNEGKMAQALPYVDSLKGASRIAAITWYNSAKDHVAVRQAAEAILAHAASLEI